MLSYQHAYHAGNHADILKHYVLMSVINYMNKKEKPYTFFDTHSGSGLYRIDDERAKKTGEIESGVMKLIHANTDPNRQPGVAQICKAMSDGNANVLINISAEAGDAAPTGDATFSGSYNSQIGELNDFVSYLQTYLDKNEYPGSPTIEADFLREKDFLVLSELHPKEIENLKRNMKRRHCGNKNPQFENKFSDGQTASCDISPQIQIHKRDGFEMLYSLTPPKTKRGAVLIDPSYEEKSDYSDVESCVLRTFKKWSGGVFMIWYPLLSYRMGMIENMVERITEGVRVISPNTDVNDFRLCVSDENSHEETTLSETATPRLFGSGMLVINPPWTLKDEMEKVLLILQRTLYKK